VLGGCRCLARHRAQLSAERIKASSQHGLGAGAIQVRIGHPRDGGGQLTRSAILAFDRRSDQSQDVGAALQHNARRRGSTAGHALGQQHLDSTQLHPEPRGLVDQRAQRQHGRIAEQRRRG
jgi:hypothetical protein